MKLRAPIRTFHNLLAGGAFSPMREVLFAALRRLLPAGGMAVALFIVGCNSGDDEYREFGAADDVENVDPVEDDHHHHDHGPHGGHIVELGGEDYHAEVVFDADSRALTVYLLGGDAETAMPVDAPTVTLNLEVEGAPHSVELSAAPQDGESEGAASRFTAAGDAVPAAVEDEEDLHGFVVVMIDGTQYRGEITHDHDHGHEHEDEDHDH